jgi:hypothetical protein
MSGAWRIRDSQRGSECRGRVQTGLVEMMMIAMVRCLREFGLCAWEFEWAKATGPNTALGLGYRRRHRHRGCLKIGVSVLCTCLR